MPGSSLNLPALLSFLTGNPRAFQILSIVPFIFCAIVQSCQHMCVWRHTNATLATCCNEYTRIIALLSSAFTCRLEILCLLYSAASCIIKTNAAENNSCII